MSGKRYATRRIGSGDPARRGSGRRKVTDWGCPVPAAGALGRGPAAEPADLLGASDASAPTASPSDDPTLWHIEPRMQTAFPEPGASPTLRHRRCLCHAHHLGTAAQRRSRPAAAT